MEIPAPLRTVVGIGERAAFRTLMNLPERVQRRLVGKPVVVDGQTLDTDTQVLLLLHRIAGGRPSESLPMEQGRAAMRRNAMLASGAQPIGAVRDLEVAGRPARLYTPSQPSPRRPLLVFFHGGGFMQGDLDSHDGACRHLAERSGVPVLSCDYRMAPEDKFPAAYDDALAAYRWVVAHADELGADPQRLGVGGDSAGGNLAAGTAIAAAAEGLPCAFQLLIYPMTDVAHEGQSYDLFCEGFFLTKDFMELANERYLGPEVDEKDPRVSVRYAEVPPGLAPAYVATAGFDPLRDEAESFARKLADAGVQVELRRFPGQIHGFFNVVGAGRTARAAAGEVADALRAALG